MPHVYHINEIEFERVESISVTSNTGSDSLKSEFGHLPILKQIEFLENCILHKGLHYFHLRKEHSLDNPDLDFSEGNYIREISINELILNFKFKYGTWVKFYMKDDNLEFDHVLLKNEDLTFVDGKLMTENSFYYSIPFLKAIFNFYREASKLRFKFVNGTLAFKVFDGAKNSDLGEIYDFSYDPPHGGGILLEN